MTKRLASVFQIKPGEGRLVALLITLTFLPSAGGAVGSPGVEALFFARFGVQFLPYMYIALAGITLAASLLVTNLLERLPRRRLYLGLPAAMALFLLVARGLVSLDLRWLYPVLWLGMYLLWTLQALFAWGLAGSVCNTRQAKRLFPLFGAGGILGLAVGGLLTQPLVGVLGTENLLLIWALSLLGALALVPVLTAGLPRRAPRHRRASQPEGRLRGFQLVRGLPLMRWVALAAMLFSFLLYALAFPFAQGVAAQFATEDALTGFLGLFQGLNTGVALVASLFLSNRLYARFGFMPTLLILPAIYLVGFLTLLAIGLVPAMGAFLVLAVFRFSQMAWLHGVALTALQAIYNVVPADWREQTRTFVDGVPTQAGIALVGLGLLVGGDALRAWHLYLAGVVAALLAILALLRANRAYGAALAQALRAGQPHIFYGDEERFGGYPHDAAAIAAAFRGAADPDPTVRRVSTEILGNLQVSGTADALVTALADPDLEVQQTALRSLQRADASPALLDVALHLQADEPEVRLLALETLIRLARYPRGLAHLLRPLLADPSPPVRGRAASTLLKAGPDESATELLHTMVLSPDVQARTAALEALAELGDGSHYDLAARALEDPIPQVRRAAIAALPRIDRERCLVPLARILGDTDQDVRAAAAQALAEFGPAALPLLHNALAEPSQEDGALGAIDLLQEPPPVSLLHDYAQTKASLGRQYAGWRAAVSRLGEQNARLDLLASALAEAAHAQALRATHAAGQLARDPDRHLTLAALTSPDAAQRANALEMVEGWPTRDLLRPVFPLLEDDGDPAPSAPVSAPAASLTAALTPILHDANAWLRACAAFAAEGAADPALLGQLKRLAETDSDELVRVTSAASLGASHADQVRPTQDALAAHQAEVPMETLATLSLMERIVFLKRVPLFKMLPTSELKTVASIADERYHLPGDVIARQGEPGDEMFIIVSGAIRVMDEGVSNRAQEIARRGPGEYVGEMAAISQEPRMASLVADGEVRVLSIEQKTFEAILRERPAIGLAVMRELCARLRAAQAAGLAASS